MVIWSLFNIVTKVLAEILENLLVLVKIVATGQQTQASGEHTNHISNVFNNLSLHWRIGNVNIYIRNIDGKPGCQAVPCF